MTSVTHDEMPTGERAETGASGPGVAIQATNLVKVFGRGPTAVRAIDGVSVSFEQGRMTAIMGPSGSGKSTLMHCLAGLDSVTSGEVWLGHTALSSLTDSGLTKLRRERVGFVFQSFNLLGMLTARQNVLLPFDLSGRDPDWSWFDSVIEVLGLTRRLDHRPAELSGGEQQRVAVARALVTRPNVLFADEPTGNLDRATGAELLRFLRTSVDELGQTVVLVTHDPVAASTADRVVVLADGRIGGEVAGRPTPEQLLAVIGDGRQ